MKSNYPNIWLLIRINNSPFWIYSDSSRKSIKYFFIELYLILKQFIIFFIFVNVLIKWLALFISNLFFEFFQVFPSRRINFIQNFLWCWSILNHFPCSSICIFTSNYSIFNFINFFWGICDWNRWLTIILSIFKVF